MVEIEAETIVIEEEEPVPEETNNEEVVVDNLYDVTPEEDEVLQVVLTDGETIQLETDVDEETFSTFNTFKSTQFFVQEFERSSGLLTADDDEEVFDEDKNFFEDELVDGVANWLLIVIGVVTLLFICLATYICIQMRRNKSERQL